MSTRPPTTAYPRLARAAIALGLGLASTGCPPQGAAVLAPVETVEPALGDDVFVRATGSGATEAEAEAAARVALGEALLGDAAWTELAELEVHRPTLDPRRAQTSADGAEVELGLTRAQAAAVLSAFESAEPPADGPPAWRDALTAARRAHLAAHACARRRELFGSECEPVDTTEADAALMQLGQGLVLDPVYRYGVPVDAEGRPLRDPAVWVFWGGVPVAEVPVAAPGPADAPALGRGRSDLTGRAAIEVADDAPLAPLRIAVDGEALLGPLRSLAPRAEATLEPVTVGWDRWGMVIGRKGEGWLRSDATMAGLHEGMRKAGHGDPMLMTPTESEPLVDTRGDARTEAARAVGDLYSGRLDVVLVLDYDSRFASRMGGNRVWYEAEGTLEARSAWTGEVLARAEARVEADGIGDERAEKAARRKLAATLIEQVLDDPPPAQPPG